MAMSIGLGVFMFTAIVLMLVAVILMARSRLVSTGLVNITINDDPEKAIQLPAGGKLLNALADRQIFLSSACGGGGTCAQCKVKVIDGGGEILETEKGHINKKEAAEGERLGLPHVESGPLVRSSYHARDSLASAN